MVKLLAWIVRVVECPSTLPQMVKLLAWIVRVV